MNSIDAISKIIKSLTLYLNDWKYNIDDYLDDDPEEAYNQIIDTWYNLEDEELKCSPKEFIDNAPLPESAGEVCSIIIELSNKLNVSIISCIRNYLKRSEYTLEAVEYILSLTTAETDMNNNTSKDVEAYLEAVLIAGMYKELIPVLIDVYRRGNSANELLFENISESLLLQKAYNESSEFLNTENIDYKHLSLISMLSNHADKNDTVYKCLKSCFKRASDHTLKMTIAYAIEDYGDSRAVPVLRAFAQQLIKKMNEAPDENTKSEVYIMLSIIKNLGGNVEDIQIF